MIRYSQPVSKNAKSLSDEDVKEEKEKNELEESEEDE